MSIKPIICRSYEKKETTTKMNSRVRRTARRTELKLWRAEMTRNYAVKGSFQNQKMAKLAT